MSDAELVAAAITRSGLSARQFATKVMGRDERTIRRWLAGEVLPDQAREWLLALESVTPRPRSLTVKLRR